MDFDYNFINEASDDEFNATAIPEAELSEKFDKADVVIVI